MTPALPAEVEIAVVGGGIAGLSAAWELRDRRVLVLEAAERAGGRLMSEQRGPYWMNFGGHVLAGPDSATGRLLASTGVTAVEVPGALAALGFGGALLSGRIETFPLRLRLTGQERLALIRAGLRLRLAVARYGRMSATRPRETPAQRRARVLGFGDDQTFSQFIGDLPPRVDSIFRATIRRSSGEPEQVAAGYGIGYFQLVWDRKAGLTQHILGGSSVLAQTITSGLGGRVVTGAVASRVQQHSSGVAVTVSHRGSEHRLQARHVIMATPAYVTRSVVSELPVDMSRALGQMTYGPYVVGAFLTDEDRPMPYDDVYAVATPECSFNMLFNIANVVRSGTRRAGGALMVYSGGELAGRLATRDDAAIADLYARDLERLFGGLRGRFAERQIKRWEHGLPHPRPGRHRQQAALERPHGRIQLAGDYLGTSYVDTAIETGTAAAQAIRRALQAEAVA